MNTDKHLSNDNAVGQLFPGKTWQAISANYTHAVAIDADGIPYSWGDNSHGQLGRGDTRQTLYNPSRIGTMASVRSVAAGQFHTLVVDQDGNLYGAGWSMFGALGNGQTGNEAQPDYANLVEVAPAFTFGPWKAVQSKGYLSMGLLEDGSLYMWGKNDRGAVGNGSTADQPVPVKISSGGLSASWTQISAGWDVAAAIDNNGDLYMWGDNSAGQCSLTALNSAPLLNRPAKVIYNGFAWSQVSVGRTHVLAVDVDQGLLWTWGVGNAGQLGLGPGLLKVQFHAQRVQIPAAYSKIVSIHAGDLVSGAITETADGKRQVWVWGQDTLGAVSGVTPGQGLVYAPTRPSGTDDNLYGWFALALGQSFTLALNAST